ncbi:hypothetical protein [Mucilaginibacter agri]|uniref:VCBS repeat-containing protein n=1 Tax=Mucilaginibacter agri TaxID=2695265 RepID=A0A966DTC1_9SPHI|nr:hypothetical protein [Mucilaginibacter agri]NCD70510.1 hypothetical protein [Mucilaginibacter agri]
MKAIGIALLIVGFNLKACAETNNLPQWFLQSFSSLKLEKQYKVIQPCKPAFLEADFNGDKQNDIAVQIIDLKSKKRGLLIINGGQNNYFIFGCGKKFADETFSDTNWLNGWRVFKSRYAYKPTFNTDGDITGSKRVNLKFPAISIYSREDGDEIAGQYIYWNNNKYISTHQGE